MKNRIYIILMVISINLFSLKNWQIYTNSTHIYEIEQVDSKIFIATWGGLEVYDLNTNGFEKKYTTIDGLSKNDIRALDYFAEREELLFGTYGGGVNRMVDSEFQMPINEIIGLASDYVNKIVHQDSLIFIATKNGLSIFINNPTFPFPFLVDNYNVENGLSANNITSLQIADNGYLYCGNEFGLDYVHIDSIGFINSWHHLNTENSLIPSNNISSISIKENKIAIATDNGVLKSSDLNDPEQSQLYCEGLAVFPVFWDDQDNLWLSYGVWDSDLLVIHDTMDIAVTRISENGDVDDWLQNETGLTTTSIMDFEEIDDQICAITWGEGLLIFNSDNWETQIKPDCIIANVVTDMKFDNNNKLWVSNGHIGGGMISKGTRGVSGFDGEHWINFSANDSPLNSDNIFTVGVDSNNRKWFGSWDTNFQLTGWRDGISIFDEDNQSWQYITHYTHNLLPSNTISCIVKDNDDNMWVGSYPEGVVIFNTNDEIIHSFNLYQPATGYNFHDIKRLYITEEKTIIGCRYNGLRIWNDQSFPEDYGAHWIKPPFTELLVAEIYSIEKKSNSTTEEIWVASSNGLFMYDNEHWFQYGTNIKKQVWLNNDWFGSETPDPEYWYYEGQERLYGSIPTYPTALYIDPFGLIWIGTRDAGITVFNKEKDIFTNLTTENTPLISNNITAFTYESFTGTLYIGTSDGLNSVEIGISAESNTETKLYNTIAYPNPFYPDNSEILRIENESSITMPKGKTICNIYDLSGELILKLDKDIYEQFSWDGNNKAGKKCSSGIYFYVVSTSDGQVSKGKIVLVR